MRAEHETKQGSFWVRDPVWHHRSLGHDAGPGSNCRHISNLTTHILENWIKVKVSCTVMSVSLWPHGLLPARLLCPWNFPGKNTGVGCHFFSRESSPPRDWTWVSCIAGRFFTNWVTRKSQKIEYNDTCKKKKKEYPRTKWRLFQESQTCSILKSHSRDFPGGTVAKTLCSNAGGLGSTPGQGTRSDVLQPIHMPQLKISHATMNVKDPTCHN